MSVEQVGGKKTTRRGWWRAPAVLAVGSAAFQSPEGEIEEMAGERMCAREGCGRIGLRTSQKRCESCGFVTLGWNEDQAQRLRDPAVPAPPTPAFRVGIPVSTSNDVPGWEVIEYIGEVFGVFVRSRGALPQLAANLKATFGGELETMTNLLRSTRQQAIERLIEEAGHRGADAIIAMRCDVTTMGDTSGWTEVCAYGTAVKARRLSADTTERKVPTQQPRAADG